MTNKRPAPTYKGPSLKVVTTYEKAMVLLELKRLGETPLAPLPAFDDAPLLDDDPSWTPADPVDLIAQGEALSLASWRSQLFSAYVSHWASALSDAACWTVVESQNGKPTPISEKRYTSKATLIRLVNEVIYQKEIQCT